MCYYLLLCGHEFLPDLLFNNLISESILRQEHVKVLLIRLRGWSSFWFEMSLVNLRCEFGTAGSFVYFVFRTIEEALFWNILILHYFSFSKTHYFFPKLTFCFSDKKKYFDYCYKEGGKKVKFYLALSVSGIVQMYFL